MRIYAEFTTLSLILTRGISSTYFCVTLAIVLARQFLSYQNKHKANGSIWASVGKIIFLKAEKICNSLLSRVTPVQHCDSANT